LIDVEEAPALSPPGSGWLARRDPRLRVLAALAFALVTVSLSNPGVALAALVLAALLFAAGDGHLRPLLRRLLALEALMLLLLVTLPFSVAGEPLLTMGPLNASREGLATALLILLKANAVVIAVLALVGTLEPMAFAHALARLGCPEKLVHLLALTVRQVHLLERELERLRRAMRARAFVARSDRHTWRSYGHLLGMLLVRSLQRSRRIHAAMRCRGFHGRLYLLDDTAWTAADTIAAVAFLALLGGLVALDAPA
jgi:cobalt/nickel transport system permease protein